MFQDEVKEKGIMSVPTTYKDGQVLTSGRSSLEQLLELVTGPQSEGLLRIKASLTFWLSGAVRQVTVSHLSCS